MPIPASLAAARRSGRPEDLHAEMASLLIDRRAAAEAVTADDLIVHGFTPDEIAEVLPSAIAIAIARTATRRIRPALAKRAA